MPFRPLSSRGSGPDPRYDEPREGIPDYMLEPILGWVDDRVRAGGRPRETLLRTIQMTLRMEPPLNWFQGGYSAANSLRSRIAAERELGLDVIDVLLHLRLSDQAVGELAHILLAGGSAWEISSIAEGGAQLSRRTAGPVRESIEEVSGPSARAHHHLMLAWSRLQGRNPDPSAAYREAIRAVEAAAKPVVSPDNPRTTLGTVIRDIRAKPDKWTFVLEGASAASVADMAASIWTGQLDRHGTDDDSIPLNVTQEQADAAVHIALALVRIFAVALIKST